MEAELHGWKSSVQHLRPTKKLSPKQSIAVKKSEKKVQTDTNSV